MSSTAAAKIRHPQRLGIFVGQAAKNIKIAVILTICKSTIFAIFAKKTAKNPIFYAKKLDKMGFLWYNIYMISI